MDCMKSFNHSVLLWGILYLLAHGGILLIPNAIFWDDWVLYRAESETLFDLFGQAGSMFNLTGYLHVVMLTVGPWIYKISTFVLMFASGLLLNQIIKRHVDISAETRFFIVLLFLILPFNIARVSLMNFPYTFRYFLFFSAWLLMDRYRIVALLLFFLSFNTNSLLVFYSAPVLDMFYRSGHLSSLRSALVFGARRIDYILLPFVYFFIKNYYFPPSGIYENYNQLYDIKNLLLSPLSQIHDLVRADVNIILSLFGSLLAFFLIKNRSLVIKENEGALRLIMGCGFFVFFLGVFPYWILGLTPTFDGWASRHQLLLPLGGALLIIGAWSKYNLSGKTVIISIIIGVSLAFNVSHYAELFVDWKKQQQLISLFAKNSDLERAGLILFEDRTENFNAFKRKYMFYELNGMLNAAFGDEKRFSIQRSDLDGYLVGDFDRLFLPHFKAGLFQKEAPLPQMLVKVDVVKPQSVGEKIASVAFPTFILSVSEIDLASSR